MGRHHATAEQSRQGVCRRLVNLLLTLIGSLAHAGDGCMCSPPGFGWAALVMALTLGAAWIIDKRADRVVTAERKARRAAPPPPYGRIAPPKRRMAATLPNRALRYMRAYQRSQSLPKPLLQCLTAIACALAWQASAGAAETLRQAVASAMARFPEIQSAQHRLEAARAQVGQARAELLPAMNGSLGQGRERSRNVSTRAAPGDEVTLRRQEAELSVTQLLFDGGAATGQVRRFAARAKGAELIMMGTAEDVAFRASQAFVEVRRLREQLSIARENIAIHERTLSDVTALADAGRGRRADVTQAEARRSLATSSAEQLAGQLAQAESAFRYLVGRPPGELQAPPALEARIPARVDEAVREALAQDPIVKAAEKEVEAAQHDRESARARLAVPRLTLEAGASRNRDIDGIAGSNHDRYAMLRLRYNFFRGFGESERVRETQARIEEALAELARVRNEVDRDVRQAWDALTSDRFRLPQLAQYARASTDVAEAYRLQFQLGLRSLLDVLNAENERYNAVGALTAGRAALILDELRLLASQGRLLEALDVPRPGSASTPVSPAAPAAKLAERTERVCDGDAAPNSNCLILRLDRRMPEGQLPAPLTETRSP